MSFVARDWDAGVPDEAALTADVPLRRVLAFCMDGILLAALGGIAFLVLLLFGVLTLGLGLPLLGLLPALPLAYNALTPLTGLRATPGQALLGLQLVRDSDLGKPDVAQTLLWSFGFTITIAAGVVWFAIALLTVRHRTLHDMLAGVTVVRRGALPNRGLRNTAHSWNTRRTQRWFE